MGDGRKAGRAHGLDEPLVGMRDTHNRRNCCQLYSAIVFVGRNPTSLHFLSIDREQLAAGRNLLAEAMSFVVMQKQTSCTLFCGRRITLLQQGSRTSANFHSSQEEE